MSAPARYEAAGLDVLQGVRVTGLDRREGRWRARVEGGALPDGRWRDLVVALPPAQAAELLGEPCPRLAEEAARVRMLPCRAVLVGFSGPLPLEFDGAFVDDDRLSWVARNSSKPGRSLAEAWVLHGSAGWSERRWDASPAAAVRELLGALAERTGRALPGPAHVDVHGWRYALAEQPLETGCLWDASARAAVCGDWCAGSRVEGAFLSGLAAAAAVDEP
jgi:predicted NAD/FAD-dependent oxidoreductase